MVKYFVSTKTKSTGKLRNWSVNAKNIANVKKRFSKKKFIILRIGRSRV